MTDITPLEWVATGFIALLGGTATGASGFGFGLVTTPILLWFLSAPMVVLTNLATTVALRIPLLWVDRKHVDLRRAAPLALGGAIGMPVGLLIIVQFTASEIRIWAGTLIIILSIGQFIGSERLPAARSWFGASAVSVGAASGALNTSISLSGPPMVLWLLNQRLRGRDFRGTMSAASLALNVGGVILLVVSGVAKAEWLWLPVITYAAAALGTLIGHRLLTKISPRLFARLVAGLVIVVSAITVLASLGRT